MLPSWEFWFIIFALDAFLPENDVINDIAQGIARSCHSTRSPQVDLPFPVSLLSSGDIKLPQLFASTNPLIYLIFSH